MTPAAIYLRISRDITGERLGVNRQREAAKRYATANGYEVSEVFTDNDISAAGGKSRPGFEALLAGLAAGRFFVVIAWNWDRLTRNRRDTVRLIETGQTAKAKVALIRGSDLDMSTPSGRMTAEILAEVAQNEIESKGERAVPGSAPASDDGARPEGHPTPRVHHQRRRHRCRGTRRLLLSMTLLTPAEHLVSQLTAEPTSRAATISSLCAAVHE